MTRYLVIVESPTKAKTLERYLGADYVVESSIGHIRDLPKSTSKTDKFGVDVEGDFTPTYVVSPDKAKKIAELKHQLAKVDELLLATDEDREGEAISWHLLEVLKPKIPTRRMVFHEITQQAIARALEHTRDIDQHLVNAQEARRIVDRLYGYMVSPILWSKIRTNLSAGRVQSVATKMVVEREQARIRFVAATWWDLTAKVATAAGRDLDARLSALDGKRLATGKDFDPDTGTLKGGAGLVHLEESAAKRLAAGLVGATFAVREVEEKPFTRSPAPPFITSTLQQEGNRKLRLSAKETMRVAQKLYENGFITYMRTDSVVLSDEAIRLARTEIERRYGAAVLPAEPRRFRSKVKNAQEAHEAIRPAGDRIATVDEVRRAMGDAEARLYELIWQRTLASQMLDARGRRVAIRIGASAAGQDCVFLATGQTYDFRGFLLAYAEGHDDPEAEGEEREAVLPAVATGDVLAPRAVTPEAHHTQPPARLTEASLVKALEESGIGRPSTYATIIDRITDRNYVFKKGSALVPTFTAFAVVALMRDHLGHLVDVGFTAKMEASLDEIAGGAAALPYLRAFYHGNGAPGLKGLLERKAKEIEPAKVCAIPIGTDAAGVAYTVRVLRSGDFLIAGESLASVPEGLCPDELSLPRAVELIEAAKRGDQPIGNHPTTGAPIYVKRGRFGPYVQQGDAVEDQDPPKRATIPKEIDPTTISLDVALALLALPRTVGSDANGVPILAHNGRYGPYIKRGDDTRSLGKLTPLGVTLEEALALLAQPKTRGRRTPEPIKVFPKVAALADADVRLMTGRYGPYVTDGTTNASLPRDYTDPMALTVEEAVALIVARQGIAPSKKKRGASKKKAAGGKKKAGGGKKAGGKKKASAAG